MDPLSAPLTLPCGVVLPGRMVKAAMTEGLSDEWNRANHKHVTLYKRWSSHHNGGHVLITGNVMVDRRHLERPLNVVIDGDQDSDKLERLRAYARAAQQDGTHAWVQLSHPGRQANGLVNASPVGPSAVAVEVLPGTMPMAMPRAMTLAEITDVVARFVRAARVCKEVGFRGVQIHAAHGYLISQFLSPKANVRTDDYGGSLSNRARLLLEVVGAVSDAVRDAGFVVAVKINSSDFQKGGFSDNDCVEVARMLDGSIDVLELSGGNYENPSMMFGQTGFAEMQSLQALGTITSTQAREGYFLVFAAAVRKAVKQTKIMVTGGMRSRAVMEHCIQSGAADLIGIARPLAGDPECVGRLLRHESSTLPAYENTLDLPWWLRWSRYVIIGNLIRAGGMLRFADYMIEVVASGATDAELEQARHASLLWLSVKGELDAQRQAASLKGLDTVGFVLNAPRRTVTPARVAVGITLLAYALVRWRGKL